MQIISNEQIDEYLESLEERVKNPEVQNNILKYETKVNFNAFTNQIKTIKENIDLLNESEINKLKNSTNSFIDLTESEASIYVNKIKIMDSIHSIGKIYKNINDKKSENKISIEEFENRYNELINQLNNKDDEPNLILETKEKHPFKVFKNQKDSLVIKAGKEKTEMVISKEKFLSMYLGSSNTDYYKSYSDVMIEKIVDNSIFDYILKKKDIDIDKINEINKERNFALKKIEELEKEKYIISGKFQELEKRFDSFQLTEDKVELIQQKAEKANETIKAIENAVTRDLQLQKSYKFWEVKQNIYREAYQLYAKLSLFSFLITILTVLYYKINYIHPEKFILVEYGFLIFVTSMMIWSIKIAIKIMLSNYHLYIDAGERVIMLRTFLSLLKENKGIAEEDKKIMIENIFRPTNHGVIKDESNISIIDLIKALKSK